jgi:uncharacterized membrane protein YgaE (UPF0421/DUF939 family)
MADFMFGMFIGFIIAWVAFMLIDLFTVWRGEKVEE